MQSGITKQCQNNKATSSKKTAEKEIVAQYTLPDTDTLSSLLADLPPSEIVRETQESAVQPGDDDDFSEILCGIPIGQGLLLVTH